MTGGGGERATPVKSLGMYFDFYRDERPHQALGSPAEDGELHAVALFGLLPARLATGLGSDV